MSEIKFRTEWLTQIALLANCGTPDDVADLCCAIQRASQGLPVNEMSPLTETLFAPIAESISEDKAKSERNRANAKRKPSENERPLQEKEIDEKEKNQKKEETEKEYTDASVANTYSNIVSVLAPSLSCPELVETTSEPFAEMPTLITLPLNDGSEWPVTTEMVTEWSSLYPAVDVMQELRKMRGWCLSKPKNRKTPRGVRAFITTWLSKEQDRGPKPTARSGTPQRRLTATEIAALPIIDPFAEIRGT